MNKYSKLVSNTFIFALGTFSSKLLVYFLMPIYTDILSPDEFNKVELITSTANLLIPIVAVCIAESVIRFGLDKASNKAQVFSAGIYTVLIGYLIFLLFIPLVNLNPFTTGYTHLIYLFVLGSSLKGVCSQYIRAKGYVKLYAVDGLFSTAMVIAFNILGLVVFKLGITGFVLATILSDFISAICLFLFASLWRDIRIKIDSRLWKSMIIYSLPLIPNTIFFWITSLSDRYIVTFFEGDTVNGLYSIAYKIPAILTAVSTIFMQAAS